MMNRSLSTPVAKRMLRTTPTCTLVLVWIVTVFISIPPFAYADSAGSTPPLSIHLLETGDKGGFGYQMVYRIPVPTEKYWRFKTDFANHRQMEGEQIIHHRLVGRKGNTVFTENRYAAMPETLFTWKTRVEDHRRWLAFELIEAAGLGHRFHHGTIHVKSVGNHTEVVQTAYFDFVGAGLWVRIPWAGGMRSFLEKMVQWERSVVSQLYLGH
jgi:hypothetical protein